MPSCQRRINHHGRFHPYQGCHRLPGMMFFSEGGTEDDESLRSAFLENKASVCELDKDYIIHMDVPGVKAQQVSIEEKDGEVEITAIRLTQDGDIAKTYQEILFVDPKKADFANTKAVLSNGVLTVAVPKIVEDIIEVTINTDDSPLPVVNENIFQYSMDLPGVPSSTIQVKIHNDKLLVSGERKLGDRDIPIRRSVEISSSVETSQARAFLQHGVFTLVAPKKEGIEAGVKTESVLRTIVVEDQSMIPSFDSLNLRSNKKDEIQEKSVEDEDWDTVMDEDQKNEKNQGTLKNND